MCSIGSPSYLTTALVSVPLEEYKRLVGQEKFSALPSVSAETLKEKFPYLFEQPKKEVKEKEGERAVNGKNDFISLGEFYPRHKDKINRGDELVVTERRDEYYVCIVFRPTSNTLGLPIKRGIIVSRALLEGFGHLSRQSSVDMAAVLRRYEKQQIAEDKRARRILESIA
jgi:hypothetical protein